MARILPHGHVIKNNHIERLPPHGKSKCVAEARLLSDRDTQGQKGCSNNAEQARGCRNGDDGTGSERLDIISAAPFKFAVRAKGQQLHRVALGKKLAEIVADFLSGLPGLRRGQVRR